MTVIFDFGGVIITLTPDEAVRRFEALGLADAAQRLDSYTQTGIFGDMEAGRITAEEFRVELSKLCGRDVSHDECRHAVLGYAGGVPRRGLDTLLRLRREGHRVVLLSNTNAYMMEWAHSREFSGDGHPLDFYMDALYASYELGCMKPDARFFRQVLAAEGLRPADAIFIDDGARNVEAARRLGMRAILAENGKDWAAELDREMNRKQ